jgi:hypothetical protein
MIYIIMYPLYRLPQVVITTIISRMIVFCGIHFAFSHSQQEYQIPSTSFLLFSSSSYLWLSNWSIGYKGWIREHANSIKCFWSQEITIKFSLLTFVHPLDIKQRNHTVHFEFWFLHENICFVSFFYTINSFGFVIQISFNMSNGISFNMSNVMAWR